MAVDIATGGPFSGKRRFVDQEIERREAEGELGLTLIDFTALYRALVPGAQSQLRDQRVKDTGASRLVGAAFEWAAGAVAARELSGYVTTQSPRRALQLRQRFGGESQIFNVEASIEDLADRTVAHERTLARRIPRAGDEASDIDRQCREQGRAYLREREALVDEAIEVKARGGRFVRTGAVREFDRGLWLRGLTPAGRDALDELVHLGNPEPSPTDLFDFMVKNR